MTIIPKPALEQHIAILGKTGSGKSYAAKGIVEGLLREGRRGLRALRTAGPIVGGNRDRMTPAETLAG